MLTPFSSKVFHGLLVTCFRSLALLFQLFEMMISVVLKELWKEVLDTAIFVMILVRKNVYKYVDLLKMFSSVVKGY